MERQEILNFRFHISDFPVDVPLLLLAIAAAGAPILIADANDRIVWANRAFSELSGLAAETIPGMTCASFGRTESLDADLFPLQHSSLQKQVHRMRLTGTRSDGVRFVAEAVVTPLVANGDGPGTYFVIVMHDVTHSTAVFDKARLRATQDELTGLACRSHIVGLLDNAFTAPQDPNQLLAVLFIDLDGFKKINDSFGHLVGDCLLKAVAARLAGLVRSSETVARFGGDEFLILLPAVSGRKAAKRIGAYIVQQLAQPFAIGPKLHHISASVGIAFRPDHGKTAELLLMRADEAMYRAKGKGGNRMAVATRCGDTAHPTRFEAPQSWNAAYVHNNTCTHRPSPEGRKE